MFNGLFMIENNCIAFALSILNKAVYTPLKNEVPPKKNNKPTAIHTSLLLKKRFSEPGLMLNK